MTKRSILLSSNYNAWPEAFNGQSFAFLNVIAQVEDAQVLAPGGVKYTQGRAVRPNFPYLFGELYYRSLSQLRRKTGRAGLSNMAPTTVDRDHDVFLFMCQFPHELSALERIKGWRERCGIAVAFVLETWSHLYPTVKNEIALLNRFDHVFVLNADCIPNLARHVKAPISFLATASDCLLSTPVPGNPDRSIDVFSMGRRSPEVHEKMVELAARDNGFLYVHDTGKGGSIVNWRQHRLLTANQIKRSKYFIAYDHTVVDVGGESKDHQEQALSTRYFEGAAGGAIILGTPPGCKEFGQFFDWEDAVVDLPVDVADVGAFLADLGGQVDRIDAARKNNIVQSLRRHDWAHRWDEIRATLGLERTAAHEARLEKLATLAGMAERSIDGKVRLEQRITA